MATINKEKLLMYLNDLILTNAPDEYTIASERQEKERYTKALQEVFDIIADFPSEDWTPCKKRLPDGIGKVLVQHAYTGEISLVNAHTVRGNPKVWAAWRPEPEKYAVGTSK